MGKCLSCFKKDNTNSNQTEDQDRQLGYSTVSYSADSRNSSDLSASNNPNRQPCSISFIADSSQPLSLESVEPSSNGTHKAAMGVTGGGTNGGASSDKRSYYSRIPPLTRSSTQENRRQSARESYSEAKVNSLFDVYKHSEPPVEGEAVMLAEGIQKLCNDMDVQPDDFRVLLFAWKCEAETMCRFTRSEFVCGCRSLKVDSVKGIVSKFPEMEAEAQNIESFKKMYKWAFKFGLDIDIGQRILPSDMASVLWSLVFEKRKPAILDRWLAFLESHPNVRGIPRDTWNMFLNFSETIGEDLSSYDDTEAWPSLFDDFVEYENDQLNQNIPKDQKA